MMWRKRDALKEKSVPMPILRPKISRGKPSFQALIPTMISVLSGNKFTSRIVSWLKNLHWVPLNQEHSSPSEYRLFRAMRQKYKDRERGEKTPVTLLSPLLQKSSTGRRSDSNRPTDRMSFYTTPLRLMSSLSGLYQLGKGKINY